MTNVEDVVVTTDGHPWKSSHLWSLPKTSPPAPVLHPPSPPVPSLLTGRFAKTVHHSPLVTSNIHGAGSQVEREKAAILSRALSSATRWAHRSDLSDSADGPGPDTDTSRSSSPSVPFRASQSGSRAHALAATRQVIERRGLSQFSPSSSLSPSQSPPPGERWIGAHTEPS